MMSNCPPALTRAGAVAVLLFGVTACAAGSSPAPTTDASPSSTAQERATADPTPTTTPGRTDVRIRLTVDGTPLDATLNDSATARDFAAQLPLTLSLSDFHQTERIADLPSGLSTSGAPEGAEPRAGDLAYYAPWGNLAVFYRDAPYATGLVILGHVADGGTELLATANEVVISEVRP
ncbi:cyclophilin-like fold protein [Streptomyces mayteni]